MKKAILVGIIVLGIILGIGIIESFLITDESLNLGNSTDLPEDQNKPVSKPPGRNLSIDLGENLGFSTP